MELKGIVKEFVTLVVKETEINTPFSIKLMKNRGDLSTYAAYDPVSKIVYVYVKNRGIADILRSIAHELIHHKQKQDGQLNDMTNIPDIGGPIEDQANAIAGRLVKKFGKTTSYNIYDL